jgi:hypothetical protein
VPAFKAVRIDHHHVAEISDAAIAQNLGALRNQPRRIHIVHAQLFGFARKTQRTNLQKTEFRDLCRFARKPYRKFHFHRLAKRILSLLDQVIEKSRQWKGAVFKMAAKVTRRMAGRLSPS